MIPPEAPAAPSGSTLARSFGAGTALDQITGEIMPTGYTAAVVDGTITDLRSFALQCARGMGALVTMRDDPWNAPIPERLEPSTYNADRLAEVQAELADLRAMGPAKWQQAADDELAERRAAYEKAKADNIEQRRRYDAMIALVEAWEGAPEGLKPFMLEQLHTGRDFDCPAEWKWYGAPLDPMTGDEWKAQREQELMRQSAHHAAEHQKEVDRTEGRNAWIAQLRASLSPEQSA